MASAAVPQMYKMDNYSQCHLTGGLYCSFSFNIASQLQHFPLVDPLRFDRSVLNRMYCVPQLHDPASYGLRTLAHELQGVVNVSTVQLRHLQCEHIWSFPYHKTFFWCFIAVYGFLVLLSTLKDRDGTKNKSWLRALSINTNAPKLWNDNPNADFQRLKAVQGVRVLNTCLVVLWHTLLSLCIRYIRDVDQLEQNFRHPVVYYLAFFGVFSVQIFFLISTFLLTNQIYELHKREGAFTWRHCAILIVNRVFRFFPTLAVNIAITKTGVFDHSPHTFNDVNLCVNNCQKNWWYTLLQLTYMLDFNQICTPGLWYLSVDTLYYLLTILILYTLMKTGWSTAKGLGGLLAASVALFAAYLYYNKYNFMFQPYPENFKNLPETSEMNLVYSPPLASWSSSLLGIALGHLYYKYKGHPREEVPDYGHVATVFLVLVPLATLQLSTYSYKGVVGALMGAFLKPLFVLPLGLALLAMAFDRLKLVKDFLESKPLLVLSNVTYCTYVFHFFVVFPKGLFEEDLLNYRTSDLVFWMVFDVLLSLTVGAVATVFLEYPGLELQKKLLPQVKRSQTKQKSN